ncbi:MAG: hypothetical protein CMK89_23405 [Pseudomonadales bacterium]|nr:hypothetical protein [Pseudomonadales bacterium]RLU02356.1 MAG: hypothetical protein D9N11_09670 [Ketobacter sp.]
MGAGFWPDYCYFEAVLLQSDDSHFGAVWYVIKAVQANEKPVSVFQHGDLWGHRQYICDLLFVF